MARWDEMLQRRGLGMDAGINPRLSYASQFSPEIASQIDVTRANVYEDTTEERLAQTQTNKRLRGVVRSRLRHCVNGESVSLLRCLELTGCSPSELRLHLESQFQVGMTWDNYGMFGWHIDHIKPLSTFDLTDDEEIQAACHFTNLQPLWAYDNLSKKNKW